MPYPRRSWVVKMSSETEESETGEVGAESRELP